MSEETKYWFVDEAGDLTLFANRRTAIVGRDGCSRFLLLGKLEAEDPADLTAKLNALRADLLAHPYFHGVESFRPERKKTALMFHAKDDFAEVRFQVFELLRREGSGFASTPSFAIRKPSCGKWSSETPPTRRIGTIPTNCTTA